MKIASYKKYDYYLVMCWEYMFLHAKLWIPDGEILVFMAVIHLFTIDEYDVTTPVFYIRVKSQINCGYVTILNQKRLSLATMAKSAIDNCFSRSVCSNSM